MKPKIDNLLHFPAGVLSPCDLSDTNSDKTISQEEETQSPPNKSPSSSGKIPASEVPYEVPDQPILPAQLQKDLVDLTDDQLAKAYSSEYGSYNSRKTSLTKQGLTMPPEFSKFRGFLNHIGINPYPGHYTVHRIDNDNPMYFPGGIKWASQKEQNNAKGDTIQLTIGGDTKPLSIWLDENPDLKENSVRSRWRKRKKGEKDYTDYQILYGAKASPPGSAANCKSSPKKAGAGPKINEFFTKPSKSTANDDVDPYSSPFTTIYKEVMEGVHKYPIARVTKADRAMLNNIARDLTVAGIPDAKAISMVLRYWQQFVNHACRKEGWFPPPPNVPTPRFMTLRVNAIPSFYAKHHEEVESIERRDKAREQRAKLNEQKYKWVAKRMKKNPEFRALKKEIKSQMSKKGSATSSMTAKEWKMVMANLEYEMDHLTQSSPLFLEAVRAWNHKQNKCN